MEISKSKIALYASLSSKKMRKRHGLFVAEGEKCVRDTLGAFPLEALVALPEWIATHKTIAHECAPAVLEAPASALKKISSLSTPPEVIAVFHMPPDEELPTISGKLTLALDGVQDPGNLGTIIRTADWFGIDLIFASYDTADAYNPKTVQSTMGSLRRVKVCYTHLPDLVRNNPGIPVYGTLLDGDNIFETQLGKEGIIVMGNEGNGLSEEMRGLVTHPLLIPPYRKDSHGESLNVAIATAVTLSTFRFGK